MLFVRASHIGARLRYSLDILFTHVLKLPFQLEKAFSEGILPQIEYGEQHYPNSLFIPACGLLEEEGLRKWRKEDFFTEKGEDILAKIFWYVTEYEKQSEPIYDAHGRYDEKAYTCFQEGWHREPLVHLWGEALWDELKRKSPKLEREKPEYQALITFDLDHPWKYLNKNIVVQFGSMAKRLLKGKWPELGEQLKSLFTGKDPYFTFEKIFLLCPPAHTLFFCLIDRHSPNDSRFSFRQKAVQKLMQHLLQKGYQLGIHPSYTTFLDGKRIAFEAEKLAEITQKPIIHSRQHFLRYRLPETFRHLIAAGIGHDFTLGMYSEIGFRTGMARPYPWFDLEKNETTALTLYPTLAMDRSLLAYMGLEPVAAVKEVSTLVEKVKKVNGMFVLLLHNDSLSESGEWKGWQVHIEKIIPLILA